MKLVIEKKEEKVVGLLSRNILAGKAVDQRVIDRQAGFWAGAMHVLNHPENAEAEMDAALKRLAEGTNDS